MLNEVTPIDGCWRMSLPLGPGVLCRERRVVSRRHAGRNHVSRSWLPQCWLAICLVSGLLGCLSSSGVADDGTETVAETADVTSIDDAAVGALTDSADHDSPPNDQTAQTQPRTPRQVHSPRELLQLMRIDHSMLRFFVDDRPLVADERESLLQLLYRLPQFKTVDLLRWTQPLDELPAMLGNPDSYRFQLFSVHGRVERCQRLAVLPELVARLGFDHYFQLQLRSGDTSFLVYTRQVPVRWLRAELRDEPNQTPGPTQAGSPTASSSRQQTLASAHGQLVGIQGLLLKRAELDEQPMLCFAADRIEWRPDSVAPQLGVSADQVTLSKLGLDVSRLDEVRQRKAIVGEDREGFYQMLAAVRSVQLSKLDADAKPANIARLLQRPETVSGQLFQIEGVARRVLEIRVPDADIQRRFGLQRYYELEVFVPLPKPVRLVDPQHGDEGKLFRDYPFSVVVPQLPAGMEQGEDVRVSVRLSGFFLKLWAYHSQFMSGANSPAAAARLQVSPLLVGPTVTVQQRSVGRQGEGDALFAGLLLGGLAMVVWFVWRSSRQDQQLTARRRNQQSPPSELWQ